MNLINGDQAINDHDKNSVNSIELIIPDNTHNITETINFEEKDEEIKSNKKFMNKFEEGAPNNKDKFQLPDFSESVSNIGSNDKVDFTFDIPL